MRFTPAAKHADMTAKHADLSGQICRSRGQTCRCINRTVPDSGVCLRLRRRQSLENLTRPYIASGVSAARRCLSLALFFSLSESQ
jgi:hypothetical protein